MTSKNKVTENQSTSAFMTSWTKSKKSAAKQGKPGNLSLITSIYTKLVGESAKEISLKDFLIITEMDDVNEIGYGRDRSRLANNQFDDENQDDDSEDEFDDEVDNEFEGHQDHKLKDVLPPDDSDDENSDEFDDEDENEFDDEDAGSDMEPPEDDSEDENSDEFDDEDSDIEPPSNVNSNQMRRHNMEGVNMSNLSMLQELLLTEKKKTIPLKKAAKSVYHRDYVKTKTKPYRKYHPEDKKGSNNETR